MNNYKQYHISFFLLLIAVFLGSCKKEFLSLKSDKALVIPSTLKDLQAIADNTAVMTGDTRSGVTPLMGELGADDYFYTDNTWTNLSPMEKNSYIWAKDIYGANTIVNDWNKSYQTIFYANVILNGIEKLPQNTNQVDRNQLAGLALFYRANSFFNLLQIFASPYDSLTATSKMGIPLPLKADVKVQYNRANIAESYLQVIHDLEQAMQLLPENSTYKTRPCKAAVSGLLGRIYLIMGKYEMAAYYANSYLQSRKDLLNYNELILSNARPIPSISNPEITYYSVMTGYLSTQPPTTLVSPGLYQLFGANDLRKDAYFNVNDQEISYKLGNYTGGYGYFSGISTAEILLIHAECMARKNNKEAAIADLNRLLKNRIATATFKEIQAVDANQALDFVLLERRKELCFRGLRWTDLRRLNRDVRYAVTLTRTVAGNTYTLAPNDPRYVYPIPNIEIEFNPLPQNVR